MNHKQSVVKSTSNTLLKKIKKHSALYIFMLPAIIYVAIFYYPMGGTDSIRILMQLSVYGAANGWIKHFKDFLNILFWRLVRNTLVISLYSMVSFPLQILLVMLNEIRNYKYKKFVQTVLYAPHFISVVMVGIITTILSPSMGVVNHILELLGCERQYFMIQPGAFIFMYGQCMAAYGMGQ